MVKAENMAASEASIKAHRSRLSDCCNHPDPSILVRPTKSESCLESIFLRLGVFLILPEGERFDKLESFIRALPIYEIGIANGNRFELFPFFVSKICCTDK